MLEKMNNLRMGIACIHNNDIPPYMPLYIFITVFHSPIHDETNFISMLRYD